MKFNKWTVGLAAVGVVSLASAARADEKITPLQTALSNTTSVVTWIRRRLGGRAPIKTRNGGPNLPAYSFAKNDGSL